MIAFEEGGALHDADALVGELGGEGEAGGSVAAAAVGAGEELVDDEGGEALAALVGGLDVGAIIPCFVDEVFEPVADGAGVFDIVDLGAGDEALVEADHALAPGEGEGGDVGVVDGAFDGGVEVGEDVGEVGGGVGVVAVLGGVGETGEDVGDLDGVDEGRGHRIRAMRSR